MCDFISWIEDNSNNIFFLTDKDVFSSHGRETLVGTLHNDVLGHGAIRAFYGPAVVGQEYEYRNFWSRDKFPPQIAVHLESPQTLLNTWGRIIRKHLQPDDAGYILRNAIEPWFSALSDILINIVIGDSHECLDLIRCRYERNAKYADKLIEGVSQSLDYSQIVLSEWPSLYRVNGLTKDHKEKLIDVVCQDSDLARDTLIEAKGLSSQQVDKLIDGVSRDAMCSFGVFDVFKRLTIQQIDKLVEAMAQNGDQASSALFCNFVKFRGKRLTKKQVDRLVNAVSKSLAASYGTLFMAKSLTRKQADKLVAQVANDSFSSYYVLRNVQTLTKRQKERLFEGVLKSCKYSSLALGCFKNLNRRQVQRLRAKAKGA